MGDDMVEKPRCQATTKAGEPCAMTPMAGQPYCYSHAPGIDLERTLARRRARKCRTDLPSVETPVVQLPPPPLRTRDDVTELLERIYGDLVHMKPGKDRAVLMMRLAQIASSHTDTHVLDTMRGEVAGMRAELAKVRSPKRVA